MIYRGNKGESAVLARCSACCITIDCGGHGELCPDVQVAIDKAVMSRSRTIAFDESRPFLFQDVLGSLAGDLENKRLELATNAIKTEEIYIRRLNQRSSCKHVTEIGRNG